MVVRRVWFGLLAAVAVVVAVNLYGAAQERFDINNFRATGAPQQTVVNGWLTNDLLTIVIVELAILIVAVASLGFAMASSQPEPANSDGAPEGFES